MALQPVQTGAQPSATTPIEYLLKLEVSNLQNKDNNGLDDIAVLTAAVPFDLWLTFKGSGSAWDLAEHAGVQYTITYYADREHGSLDNIELGKVTGTLTPGGSPYTYPDTKLSAIIPEPGIYELSAVLIFFVHNPSTGDDWVIRGVTGFAEGLVVQTYAA